MRRRRFSAAAVLAILAMLFGSVLPARGLAAATFFVRSRLRGMRQKSLELSHSVTMSNQKQQNQPHFRRIASPAHLPHFVA